MSHCLRKLKILLQCNWFYLLIVLIILVYTFIYIKNYVPLEIYDKNKSEFELTIKEFKIDGDKLSISFNEYLVGTYYFKTVNEKESFNFNLNDKVYVRGKLSLPKENTIFNMFNYKEYLYYKGILYTILIDEIELISLNNNIFYKFKNYVCNRIKKINNDYLYAFILGETYYIDNEIYNNYKTNGITHLFSLSALHVSIFSSILYFILKKFKISEIFSLIIVSSFLFFFSFISSFSSSMLRALIFFILNSLNKLYKFNIKNKNILYITFCILLIINPNNIFDIGFKLSFIITFFIILFSDNYKIKSSILSTLIISFISFLASLPLVINMSYEVNFIGFISNIFFIPLVSYILFPLSLISFVFNYFVIILEFVIKLMEYISFIFSNYFNLSIIISCLKLYEIIIYYVLLYIFIKRKSFIIILYIYILYLILKPCFDSYTDIYFLDVSQGDSILIVNQYNKSVLIDTGGKFSKEKEVWMKRNKEYNFVLSCMVPFFKSVGLKKIDFLILTHGDYDHMGWSINLVNNFKVEKVIFNCGEYNDLEKELIKVLDKKKINIIHVLKN